MTASVWTRITLLIFRPEMSSARYRAKCTVNLDTNRIPFDIPKKLNVLYANGDCIVLQFTGTKKDQKICSLWGPQNASGVDEQVCFTTFNRDCPGEIPFSYLQERDRCDLHDNLAQTYGKKPGSK